MATLKRHRGTWILILILAAGFFLLRERRSSAATTLTLTTAHTFASLDNLAGTDCDPAVGVFQPCDDNLVITAPSGAITCDESNTPASACPMHIHVTGDLEIQAGGSIHADNLGNNGGQAGDILLDVDGNFTMRAASGGSPAAFVSAQNFSGGVAHGGQITVIVGDVALDTSVFPAVGICGSPHGDILMEAGTQITSSAAQSVAGDIAMYAGHNITINGTVVAAGFTGGGHGGAITIQACCDLKIDDKGQVLSRGRDPGPDRVHLQGCSVTIYGLVASQGPAHVSPAPLCTPPLRPGKAANSSACVEIWSGTTVVLDSTGTHFGEVSADTATSGGIQGHGWVDILANGDISIIDGTNDDPGILDGFATNHLVHANQYLGNGHGGDIQVLSKAGKVSTSGNALQASDTVNGAHGGTVKVEAGGAGTPAGDVLFGTASTQAEGSTSGGLTRGGGTISGRSFNGDLSGAAGGELNAKGGPPLGSVTLEACLGATYGGTSTPAFVLGANNGICGGSPTFPALTAPEAYPLATCSTLFCQQVTDTPTPTATAPLPTRTPGNCPEDPNASMTRTVDPSGTIHQGLPNHLTVQAAYNAAANTGETIGIFGNTVENVVLGAPNGDKSMKITQCTSAQITAATSAPVWDITSTGKLTIQGPDSVGGTIGWFIHNASGGPHTLKSVRANGASIWGIRINSNGNNVTWNDVSGNGGPGGVLVAGNSNILKGGTTGPNTNDGIKITGNSNNLSGATVDGNSGNGVIVSGNTNTIKGNRASLNTLDGFANPSGTGNNYSGNSSNVSGENGGAEYSFGTAGVNGGSNRADGINVPKTSVPVKCPTFPAAGTVCE